jgi:phosphoribosylformylglycinamidine synthase
MTFQVEIFIFPKPDILDPRDRAILGALENLGFCDISNLKQARVISLTFSCLKEQIERKIKDMCEKLLVNPVIENYSYTIEKTAIPPVCNT